MRRPALPALVLAVAAMHAAALWLLMVATQPHRWADAPAARRVVMEVVEVAPPVVAMKAEPPAPRAASSAPRPIARRAPLPARGDTVSAPNAPAAAAEPPQAASPAPAPPPLILHSESTRRALRDIGRERSFSDRATQDLNGTPRSAFDSRLSTDVAGSARGDCMKGRFKGSGMGLLSLPALALAAAQGDCGR
jgi:hypothetical protein